MGKMIKCGVCGKTHEEQNFKHCNKCDTTACTWCMSKGTGGETVCQLCKKGKARPIK